MNDPVTRAATLTRNFTDRTSTRQRQTCSFCLNDAVSRLAQLAWIFVWLALCSATSVSVGCRQGEATPEQTANDKTLIDKKEDPLATQLTSAPEATAPNILLITVDTLRADHLGSYGYERNTSPNIDALARKGTVFLSAICTWPKTTPSFASMLTGTYGRTNGIRGGCRQWLPDELTTIAEVLQQDGYTTAAVVNNPNLGREFNFNQGFSDHIEMWQEKKDANCVDVTDHALHWLKDNHHKKFFLWLHYVSPHTLYRPPSPYKEMFVRDCYYKFFSDTILPVRNSYTHAIHEKNAYLKPHRNLSYYIAQYDGEIAHVDSQIKRLLEFMESYQLFQNTLVLFTSDHGEELGEHHIYFEHGTNVYQTTMHVPLIVAYPRIVPQNQKISTHVSLVDLFPTITDYAGLSPHKAIEGRSLRPLIEGQSDSQSIIYSEGGYPHKYLSTAHTVAYWKEWKIIHRSNGFWEFYNLDQDPDEKRDLSGENTSVLSTMRRMLLNWEKWKPVADTTKSESGKRSARPLSKQTTEQLKALGYMD